MKLWRYGRAIERLGERYRLDGSLGNGGMADVCLAWDEQENHEVAIKVIKQDSLDQETLNRFMKEASHVVRWDHPNILRIYDEVKLELLDIGHGSIVPYIVMEYAQGGDLQKRLTPGQPYPLGETIRLFAQLCSAVQYAHEHSAVNKALPEALDDVIFTALEEDPTKRFTSASQFWEAVRTALASQSSQKSRPTAEENATNTVPLSGSSSAVLKKPIDNASLPVKSGKQEGGLVKKNVSPPLGWNELGQTYDKDTCSRQ